MECTPTDVNQGHEPGNGPSLEKLDFFHYMEIFWKYSRKGLQNPVSIVVSNSIVWKLFPWYGNILEIKLPYCGRGPVFPVHSPPGRRKGK